MLSTNLERAGPRFARYAGRMGPASMRFMSKGQEVIFKGRKLRILKQIGEGAFRKVWEAVDLKTGKKYAAMQFDYVRRSLGSRIMNKIFGNTFDNKEEDRIRKAVVKQAVERENSNKGHLGSHQYLDTEITDETELSEEYVVIKPLAEQSLNEYVQTGKCNLPKLLQKCQEIAEGMQYMHNVGYIHRDFRKENVLVHENKAKITDFEDAQPKSQCDQKLHTQSGDIRHRDPLAEYSGEQTDIFAFMLTILDLTSPKELMSGDPERDQALLKLREYLLDKVFLFDSSKRPSIDELKAKIAEAQELARGYEDYPNVNPNSKLIDEETRTKLCDTFVHSWWDHDQKLMTRDSR